MDANISTNVVPTYADYEPLSLATVGTRIAQYPSISERLGGAPADWHVNEVGDGNLNFVYIVEGPAGSVCVKQALPYVRLLGESWPLPLSRSFFEHGALVRQAERAGHVPQILHFDAEQALNVMENLGPHIIWRKALIGRARHETAAPVVGRFHADALFRSSDLSLPADVKTREMALFAGNTALCKITEDLVFTDPWRVHEMNRWTSPQLDDTAAAVRADGPWKVAVQEMKHAFLSRAEALLHGDAHTGSMMVHKDGDAEDTRVIDPEFAFYGPMGFDIGTTLANLWLSHFSQDGHPGADGEAASYQAWLLDQCDALWGAFEQRFRTLWRTERTGDAFARSLFEDQGDAAASEAALDAYLARLQEESLGFAGAKMTRRILGLAGVADLETIEPADLRAECEKRALRLARALLVERRSLATVADANALARSIR